MSPQLVECSPNNCMYFDNDYEIGDKLGAGHYSEVFRCKSRADGTECAAKVIDKSKSSPKQLGEIMREAHVMKAIQHKYIARMVGFYDEATRLVIVMELLRGGELFHQIVKAKHFSEKIAAAIVSNCLQALQYLHSQDIIHRDLKPENILLATVPSDTDEMTLTDVRIADFGFAEVVQPPGLTKCCGTPLYIAPEVLNAGLFKTGPPYNVQADMWSMGIIAYIMICGYPPFRGKSTTEQFKKIIEGNLTFPEAKVWGGISDDAKQFVSKLLVQDPKERMTVSQALSHPWLTTQVNNNLTDSVESLKQFNATKIFRKGVWGVEAINRILYLQRCTAIGVKPNSDLERTLTEAPGPLTVLDLSLNYVGPKGLLAVLDTVAESTTITKLILGNNGANNAVVEKMCAVLKKHPTLAHIDLSKNNISHLAGRMLLHLLQSNPRITECVLTDTLLQPTMQSKIAAQLERNKAAMGKQ